ncbi:MAG TPA: hypothetical protein VFU69_16355 [Ktedonobacterales bacterium]|nr:hypothetical protein [Ktedonobacterales bacterium]
MNTPGPIYCGETDNCGTGPDNAPYNVGLDNEAFQAIYRQPTNLDELQQVVDAASFDPFHGYGADGNLHWSYETIKEWWSKQRREIEQEVRRLYEAQLAGAKKELAYWGEPKWWLGYLQDNRLYQYLQVYAFFLDNGRIPTERDTLPEL